MNTTAQLTAPIIAATAVEGLTVTLPDGRQARLAVVDETGKVIDTDVDINRQAFDASCRAYRKFLKGLGHLRAVAGNDG